ncbi:MULTISPECIES: hypothetical protein [Snodgrassella]|uniref:hypothetical protein n=1 Tax=Snodgrassella TaxID=1193515 RepID=UPI000B87F6B3|nr:MULTISPECIES: hypothetical protein [Snodgrassella]
MKIHGGDVNLNYFKSQDFFSRLALSFGALIITAAPFWIFLYVVLLCFLSIGYDYESTKYYVILVLIVTACFVVVVLMLMILGWILNCKSNFVINTIVVIAMFCALPPVVISFAFMVGILMLPLYILAGYLVYWYLKGGAKYQPKVKPALKVKIKLS